MAITHEKVRYLQESQDEKLFDDQRGALFLVDTPLAPGHQSVLYRGAVRFKEFPLQAHLFFALAEWGRSGLSLLDGQNRQKGRVHAKERVSRNHSTGCVCRRPRRSEERRVGK